MEPLCTPAPETFARASQCLSIALSAARCRVTGTFVVDRYFAAPELFYVFRPSAPEVITFSSLQPSDTACREARAPDNATAVADLALKGSEQGRRLPEPGGYPKQVITYVDTPVDLRVIATADQTQQVDKAATVTARYANRPGGDSQPIANAPITFDLASGAATRRSVSGLPATVLTDANGVATITYTSSEPGPVTVTASMPSPFLGSSERLSGAATTLWRPAPTFDSIALQPAEADLECGQPVALTALVLDGAAPVPGINVTFAFSGDCLPYLSGVLQKTAVTGPDGKARLTTIASSRPGQVAVVAAGINLRGAPVLSKPAYLTFSEEHQQRHGHHHSHWEARHGRRPEYAEEATQQAKAQLLQPSASAVIQAQPRA